MSNEFERNNMRSLLITGYTDKIGNRDKTMALTAHAVGKVFAGFTVDAGTALDTFIKPGMFRINNDVVQNPENKLPVDDITGFLQVMDINREEDETDLNTTIKVRQIVYPDNKEDCSPYTRVGTATTVNSELISWSEWGMMGGGSLRRIVMTGNTVAKNNVLYESFGAYTLTLPDPNKVPVGTQIGLEQFAESGRITCGDMIQATQPDVSYYDAEEVVSPAMVSTWTQNPNNIDIDVTVSDLTGDNEDITLRLPVVYRVMLNVMTTQEGDVKVSNIDFDQDADTTVKYDKVFGTYKPVVTSALGIERVYKKDSETDTIYLKFNPTSKNWMFVSALDLLTAEVYYAAEYAFKSADAVSYVFECALSEDGTNREWILDVDSNYAKPINLMLDHLEDMQDQIDYSRTYEIPVLGRKTIYHANTAAIHANVDASIYSDPSELSEEQLKQLVEDTLDLYFYDQIISIRNTATPVLPPAAKVVLGAKVTYHIDPGVECTVSDGVYSQKFVADNTGVLVVSFECCASELGNRWTLLTIGGDINADIVPDEEVAIGSSFVVKDAEVGTFMWWMGKLDSIPTGWLVCDGSTFDTTKYPVLAKRLGTSRLPNMINRFIKGSNTSGTIGAAGLPNITGSFFGEYAGFKSASGAFYNVRGSASCASGGSSFPTTIDFDASKSNAIYGASNTVTPPNISAIPLIKAKVSTTTTSGLSSHVGMVFACPAGEPPQGAFILNGQTISQVADEYPEFWKWVKGTTVRKLSASAYTTELNNTGVCGAFVVTEANNGTVKLPTIINGFIMGANVANAGASVEAGLPNITGTFSGYTQSNTTNCSGAFTSDNGTMAGPNRVDNYNEGQNTTNFAASRSNAIYGKSSTVQPTSVRYPWCIQVAPLEVVVPIHDIEDLRDRLTAAETLISNLNSALTTLRTAHQSLNNTVSAQSSKITALEKLDTLPVGTIMWFNKSQASTLSSKWKIYTDLIGKYPLGASSNLGTAVAAGLPNITGGYGMVSLYDPAGPNMADMYGAFVSAGDITRSGRDGQHQHYGFKFDASKSNAIYGKSTTVTPPSVKLIPYVKIS